MRIDLGTLILRANEMEERFLHTTPHDEKIHKEF